MIEMNLGRGILLGPYLTRSDVERAFPGLSKSPNNPNKLYVGSSDHNGRVFYTALVFSGQKIAYAILMHPHFRDGRRVNYDFDLERAADRDNSAWITAFFGAPPPIEGPRLSVSHAFSENGGFSSIEISFPSLASWPARLVLSAVERLLRPGRTKK